MKKYRIGIIGTENSHAHGFTRIINKPDENGNFRYPDCHVTLVWGHYPESNEQVVNEFDADKVAESIEEMLENVDAVMITARDGKFHYEFAEPFIKAGIPVFVDKPFTVDSKEAIALVELAKEKQVPICGGSVLKFVDGIQEMKKRVAEIGDKFISGALVAPLVLNSPYSGFFFYASHLVEMTLEIYGYNPKSVTASRNGENVCAIISYEGFNVTNHFNNESGGYYGAIYGKNGFSEHTEFNLDGSTELECDDFVRMLRNGEMSLDYEKYMVPVFVMNAIKESYETGKTVNL